MEAHGMAFFVFLPAAGDRRICFAYNRWENGARYYQVVPGDSLYKIAKRHAVDLEALKKLNPQFIGRRIQSKARVLKDYACLFPGDRILIVAAADTGPSATSAKK
jgi:hypothetical protein